MIQIISTMGLVSGGSKTLAKSIFLLGNIDETRYKTLSVGTEKLTDPLSPNGQPPIMMFMSTHLLIKGHTFYIICVD